MSKDERIQIIEIAGKLEGIRDRVDSVCNVILEPVTQRALYAEVHAIDGIIGELLKVGR